MGRYVRVMARQHFTRQSCPCHALAMSLSLYHQYQTFLLRLFITHTNSASTMPAASGSVAFDTFCRPVIRPQSLPAALGRILQAHIWTGTVAAQLACLSRSSWYLAYRTLLYLHIVSCMDTSLRGWWCLPPTYSSFLSTFLMIETFGLLFGYRLFAYTPDSYY